MVINTIAIPYLNLPPDLQTAENLDTLKRTFLANNPHATYRWSPDKRKNNPDKIFNTSSINDDTLSKRVATTLPREREKRSRLGSSTPAVPSTPSPRRKKPFSTRLEPSGARPFTAPALPTKSKEEFDEKETYEKALAQLLSDNPHLLQKIRAATTPL
jgi:hypothetical protein